MKTYTTNEQRKAAKSAKALEMKNSFVTIRQDANYNPYNEVEEVEEKRFYSVNEIEEMRLKSMKNQMSSSLR